MNHDIKKLKMEKYLLAIVSSIIFVSCGVSDADVGKRDGVATDDHRIFVSSELLTGNFAKDAADAFEVADAKCSDLAKTAGLVRNYKAIISTQTTHAISKLVFSGAVYKVDSVGEAHLIVATGSDLWLTDSKNLLDTVDINEKGEGSLNQSPWTGTGADGATVIGNHCSSWTDSTGSGFTGSTANFGSKWLEDIDQPCGNSAPIFCISQ